MKESDVPQTATGAAFALNQCSLVKVSVQAHTLTIGTEIKAKRNNMISELITFRIMKAKAKVKFGVKYLCGHECERSSVQLISIRKRRRRFISGNYSPFNFRVNGSLKLLVRLGLGVFPDSHKKSLQPQLPLKKGQTPEKVLAELALALSLSLSLSPSLFLVLSLYIYMCRVLE